MKNKEFENALIIWGNKLYKISAKILLRKLKNKERLDKEDYKIMQILLEHIIRGNNEK